jgi:sterol desaturase/sphingolipid hydroxylase (fatty acid hydroxylase superfamily)
MEDYAAAATVGTLAAGAIMTMVALMIAYYVILVVGYWKVFTKAGEKGWKSLIPFYNVYIQFKFSWGVKYFWITIALLFVGGIIYAISGGDPEQLYGNEAVSGGNFGMLVGALFYLAALILILISYYWLGRSFGKGWGFFILSIFFANFAIVYLGFCSAEYQGNASLEQAA